MIRFACVLMLAAAAAGCVAAVPPGQRPEAAKADPMPVPLQQVTLRNPGFENAPRPGERCPEHWECAMHADPDSFRIGVSAASPAAGKQAACIERVTHEPWAILTQAVPAAPLRGKRLRFSIAVRVERADGPGAGPWIVVHGPQVNLAHEERLQKVPGGWTRLAVEFPVAQAARLVEVGATLSGGGRACFDDARLEILE